MEYLKYTIYFILTLSVILNLFFTALGVVMIYNIMRPQKSPVDTSNRINKVRLIWFAMTREDKFVHIFPWLRNDEWENFNKPK